MDADGTFVAHARPPRSSALRHLRPRNSIALLHVTFGLTSIGAGIWLSSGTPNWPGYVAGQLLLALGFLHALVTVHEAGHLTLFTRPRWNMLAGQLAGFLALIPFASWRPLHARHHRYTGWQDLDATTAALVPRPVASWERIAINVAWRGALPIFSVLYRLQNYWYVPRLMRYLGPSGNRVAIVINAAILMLAYAGLIRWVGAAESARLVGPALYLSLMAQDIILLSQHTHMPSHLSGGGAVRPFSPVQQVAFTRSLRLPAWLSRVLMHFDAHELHHIYPGVPGYLLRRVPYRPPNEVHWWTWMRAVRRLTGTAFLFGRREQTGLSL